MTFNIMGATDKEEIVGTIKAGHGGCDTARCGHLQRGHAGAHGDAAVGFP
jgi:hypothetical protein